jgi:hypothetical protein
VGLFWDLIQQSQISEQKRRASSLEQRVIDLEQDLDRTKRTLHSLVVLLEKEYGRDIDRDGRVG